MYNAGLASYVDMLDLPGIRLLPESLLTWISKKTLRLTNLMVRPFDKVAAKYELNPFKRMERLWEGDYNLLAEPKEFCELELPQTYRYIGPLIGRLDSPIPEDILNMPKDMPIVYFAMGSSGQPKVIAKIVEGFAGKPYRVIAPVKRLLRNLDVNIPSNVIATDWLPAHKVNPMADISVIHGGIGTVMTACLAGTPVIGISMQPEQEFNIDCLVRKGFALRIRRNSFTPEKLSNAIDKLLGDKEAQRKAKEFQKVIQKADDPSFIVNFFKSAFQA